MEIEIFSATKNELPAGVHNATFTGLVAGETKVGPSYFWHFQTDTGKDVSFISDRPGKINELHKTAKWLCALATRPITAGKVNPEEYVGKKYMLIIVAKNGSAGTTLQTFSAIPAA